MFSNFYIFSYKNIMNDVFHSVLKEKMHNLSFCHKNNWIVANVDVLHVQDSHCITITELCFYCLFYKTISNARYLQAVRNIQRIKGKMSKWGKRSSLLGFSRFDFPRNQKSKVESLSGDNNRSWKWKVPRWWVKFQWNCKSSIQFQIRVSTIDCFFSEIVDSWLQWISFPIWTFESEK